MKPLGDIKDHYWLAKRMAKSSGVDLVQAFKDGEIVQQDWADMVQTCRSCTWVDGCGRWLEASHRRAETPKSCLNCHSFNALKETSPLAP